MRHTAPRLSTSAILALALCVAAPAFAQAPSGPQPGQAAPPAASAPVPAPGPMPAQEEPPARVGRVSFVSGQLGFHTKGETAWSAAAVNYPVAAGGSFWTDPKAQAELRIGAQTIDLANNTEIDIAKLDQQVIQLGLPQGRIGLHLRQLGEGNSAEIDVPRGGIWLLQPGQYDFDAGTPDRPTRITVFEGSARFVGGTLDIAIKAGDTAVIGGAETLTSSIEKAAPDAFIQWCRSRDYQEQRLAAPYHVSPRMTGYETLDEYGAWRAVPEYGEAWFPSSVPADWVPYRNGSWSWIEPWGWNWIAAEPWGFAPFHYGRWAFLNGGWGWVPGAFVPYPVYAPALVGFYSDPASIVAAAIAGAVTGWFPLGPGEAYWPSYSSDQRYISAVNAGIVAGSNALANRTFANRFAGTVVPQRIFASAGSVSHAALPVSAAAARQAGVAARAPAAARGGVAATRLGGQTMHGGRGGLATAAGSLSPAGRTASRSATLHGNGMAFRGGHGGFHGGGPAFHGGGMAVHGGGFHGGGMAFHGGHGGGPVIRGGGMAFHGGGMPHGGSGGSHGGGGGVAVHAGGGGGPHGGGGGGPHGGGGGGGGGHGGGKGHG